MRFYRYIFPTLLKIWESYLRFLETKEYRCETSIASETNKVSNITLNVYEFLLQ